MHLLWQIITKEKWGNNMKLTKEQIERINKSASRYLYDSNHGGESEKADKRYREYERSGWGD